MRHHGCCSSCVARLMVRTKQLCWLELKLIHTYCSFMHCMQLFMCKCLPLTYCGAHLRVSSEPGGTPLKAPSSQLTFRVNFSLLPPAVQSHSDLACDLAVALPSQVAQRPRCSQHSCQTGASVKCGPTGQLPAPLTGSTSNCSSSLRWHKRQSLQAATQPARQQRPA